MKKTKGKKKINLQITHIQQKHKDAVHCSFQIHPGPPLGRPLAFDFSKHLGLSHPQWSWFYEVIVLLDFGLVRWPLYCCGPSWALCFLLSAFLRKVARMVKNLERKADGTVVNWLPTMFYKCIIFNPALFRMDFNCIYVFKG